MEMEVQIGRRPKSLHERDGAALALVDAVIPSHAAVQAEESPDKDAQYRGSPSPRHRPDGSAGRRAPKEPTGVPGHAETRCPSGAPRYPSFCVRNRTDTRFALCKTAAGAAPFRTIHT